LRNSNHHDRRVRRTRKLIREAFLQLIAEKEYNNITVTDIIKKADYNRATFYRHFYDKEDLVNEITNQQIELFISAFMFPYRKQNTIDLSKIKLDQIVIFDHILEHKDFYQLWNRLKTIPGFAQKYTDSIKILYNNKIIIREALIDGVDQQLYMQFYGYGLAGLIFNWIGNGFQESAEYMAEQLKVILQSKPSISMLYPSVRETDFYSEND